MRENYVDLSEHFKRMSRFLNEVENFCGSDRGVKVESNTVTEGYTPDAIDWVPVTEPLRIAGSIREIQTETNILDDARGWLIYPGMEVARDPVEVQQMTQRLTSLYVLETNRFSLAWSAYEALAKIVAQSNSRHHQVATKLIVSFLQTHPCTFPAKGLFETFQRVRTLFNSISPRVVEEADKCAEKFGCEQYAYVQLCRIARNELVHSPEFDFSDIAWEENIVDIPQDRVEIVVWREVTRLLLLTLQSILFVYYKEAEREVDWDSLGCEDGGGQISVQSALCELHLEQGCGQLFFPFEIPSNLTPWLLNNPNPEID